jgi:hypothetical protein
MIPKELVYEISEYSYDIMCKLNSDYPIKEKNISYGLIEHASMYNYLNIVSRYFKRFTLAQKENLFEKAFMYNSINVVKWIYKFDCCFDNDILVEYIIYALREGYLDIVYYFVSKPEIDLNYNKCQILKEAIKTLNTNLVITILNAEGIRDPRYNVSDFILYTTQEIRDTIYRHPKIRSY